MSDYDAVVVGSGPNGLAAAITLARAGLRPLVLEARDTPGGGLRSAALTQPGFIHDICSAVHPLGLASPFFSKLPLQEYGLRWIQPATPLAHPLPDGSAVTLQRSLADTAAGLGRDEAAYLRLMAPLVNNWSALLKDILGPLRLPQHPLLFTQFGLRALWPARLLAETIFREPAARALFAGLAGHAILPLEQPATASFGLVLGLLGHAVGWPMPHGGAQQIADTLVAHLRDLGGTLETGVLVRDLADLPPSKAVLLDVTPRQLLAIAGDKLPASYARRLSTYQYGPGVFKVDWALDGPIPWRAAACRRAGTIHIGPFLDDIVACENDVWRGVTPQKPYILLVQPSLFDDTRAPEGRHTAWAYCHVPHGSGADMTAAIEQRVERFAPGFRDVIIDRHVMNARDMARYNPNYVGGDINGGAQTWRQLFTRPMAQRDPYRTPIDGVYLSSSATPPGGGVHGMCGYFAARSVLSRW